MREIVASQRPLVAAPFDHRHVAELAEIDRLLQAHPGVARWVHADLVRVQSHPDAGRRGMSGEQVLRVLLVKQMTGCSYEHLHFHLGDSASFRAFCQLGLGMAPPKVSTLKRNLKRVRAETLEKIHWVVLQEASERGVEKGRKVRIDCTVTDALIHPPSDSSLLWDGVRVLTRLMHQGNEQLALAFADHTR